MPDLTCLVTIHGIGFQQPPIGGPGYADRLQDELRRRLPTLLGGDPAPEWGRKAGEGAIYVHSEWPPSAPTVEGGLRRLGSWKRGDASHRGIDISHAPLADGDYPIAHIALVYSGLEEQQPHLGASLETIGKVLVSWPEYTTLWGMVQMGFTDLRALLRRGPGKRQETPSLRVRSQQPLTLARRISGNPSGLLAVIQQLDHDVATYVVRNDLRERVRSFVHEALLRLCSRPDVARVVVNAHSQGTVLAFDVLRELPPFASAKVARLVTAGSPLRKYADLFYWGEEAGCVAQIEWQNFWDPTDPVADQLLPPKEWRRGDHLPANPAHPHLFYAVDPDTGQFLDVNMNDGQVDNLANGAGGGLPAHNYWDNGSQFLDPLARMLREVAGTTSPDAPGTMAELLRDGIPTE